MSRFSGFMFVCRIHGRCLAWRRSCLLFATLLASFTSTAEGSIRVPSLSPVQAEYALAEQAFQSGDLQRANQLYSKILEQQADQPLAWFRLGLIHQQQREFRSALHAYDNALNYLDKTSSDTDSKDSLAKIHFNRAMLLLDAAAEDLQGIPPDVLSKELEATRQAVHQHVSSALLSAASRVQLDSIKKRKTSSRARGYVYTAQRKPVPEATQATAPENSSSQSMPQSNAPRQPGTR